MNTISAIGNGPVPSSQKLDPQRLAQAVHEFEAVLLNQLLGSLEHTFSTLSGKKSEAEDHYHFLGVQALTSHIASTGGIGIADMIIRGLTHHSNRATSLEATKSPSNIEGLNLNF
jgi:Rod binding domain-containing protein